jgi:hypothetical protein
MRLFKFVQAWIMWAIEPRPMIQGFSPHEQKAFEQEWSVKHQARRPKF